VRPPIQLLANWEEFMKVTFVVPPWTFLDIRAHDTQGIAGAWPPIGSLYIAAVLREAGHQVNFYEGRFHSHAEMVDLIAADQPDVVGAFVIAMFWERTQRLFRDIRARCPHTFLVVGGHGPSARDIECLNELPELGAVVRSEAEYTMRELVNRLETGQPLDGLLGATVRVDGLPVRNPPRPFIEPLDELPFPAMDLARRYPYRPSYGQVLRLPTFQVISSRGCVNHCIYCYRLMGSKVLRLRTPENVVDEIEHYVLRYGARDIKFWDECFTFDRQRVVGMCEEILRRNIRVSWWVSARADYVDLQMLKLMKRAGCWCINIGVESGVQKNLDTLRKNLTLSQIEHAVRWTHQAGIKTFLTFIFGIPGETFEEGLETIRFAKRLDGHLAEFFPISPFPGTVLHDMASEVGVINPDVKQIGLLKEEIGFHPHTMTASQVSELRRRAFREYYFRPRRVVKYVSSIRSWFEVQGLINGFTTLLKFTRKRDDCGYNF